MKQRAIIFGAGKYGLRIKEQVKEEFELICFVDNNPEIYGIYIDEKYKVINEKEINDIEFDKVIIGSKLNAVEIVNSLKKLNIPQEKIIYKYIPKKKAYIYGVGPFAQRVYENIKDEYDFIGYIHKEKEDKNQNIYSLDILKHISNEIVFLGIPQNVEEHIESLLNNNISAKNIKTTYVDLFNEARKVVIRNFSKKLNEENVVGDVAEAGVFQGDLAKVINENFHDRRFYLFDTFEGFPDKDIESESEDWHPKTSKDNHINTSEQFVLSRMKYPKMCIIRKGYFPDTTSGLENNKFCFVSLDMDMYEPTLSGLRFFFDRMVKNGVILLHDYNSDFWKGVKEAVNDFEKEKNIKLNIVPIGDMSSIAIIKN